MTDIEDLQLRLATSLDPLERMLLLNELAFRLSRVDPVQGLTYASEADRLAQELDNRAGRAESLRVAAWCHETLCQYEAAMVKAREARELFRETGDANSEGKSLNAIGVIAFGMTDYSAALEALSEAQRLFVEVDNQPSLASAHNNAGMIHQELGRYPEALTSYLEALRINEELGDESQAAVNIGNVSNVYYYLGDIDRSFEYDGRALDVARRLNNDYGVAHALESIASNHKERGEYAAALEALNEALEIFRRLQEKRYEAAALIKLGTLRELVNDPKSALEMYKDAAAIATSIDKLDILVNARLHTGMLHLKHRRYRQAISVLRKGLAELSDNDMLKLRSELLLVLADGLDAVEEHAEASTCRKEHAIHLESLFGEERQRAVAEMQARFDVERAERERELFRVKSAHLEEMMELRTRELTSMAMRLVQKNSFLQKLRKDTIRLANENPDSGELLDELLKAIVENLRGDDEWERFEQEFQRIHHDFLERLSQQCPRLTPAELKVCAMLKINLSNKEMANLLSVSLRNIESHRYSIRKKMGLSSEVNLTAYLVGL